MLARGLMGLHGLSGWGFEFDNAKTRAGVCRSARRVLGLSRPLTLLHTEDEVRETILHEIAHALVGAEHGHGPVWQAKAREIGCTGARCITSRNGSIEADWIGTCPAGHRIARHRRPQRVQACGLCSPTFDPDALFDWTYRGHQASMDPKFSAEAADIRARRESVAAASIAGSVQAAPVPRPVLLPIGTNVTVLGSGRYAGALGRIAKQARTRYHVRTSRGLITVPFHLVRPL
jgi:predicted SprT family Zn-dependent metalloprotease